MKSLPRLSSSQKRAMTRQVDNIIENRLEAERKIFMLRVLGAMCIALHEIFGFGKIRLNRLLVRLTAELFDRDRWTDTADEVLAKNLRSMGLDDFANALLTASKEIDEVIERDWC